jgi:hypothetical protein
VRADCVAEPPPGPETPRRFLLSSPCGGSENVRKNRWASLCRPFRPRFCLSHETTRLRAWLRTSGASRLVHLPARSKNKVGNDFRASLEEAAVSRPGREAGKKNGQNQRAPKVRHQTIPAVVSTQLRSLAARRAKGRGVVHRSQSLSALQQLHGVSGENVEFRTWACRTYLRRSLR